MDLYITLEIEKGATKEDIKRAYRKLAMKYHPDRNAGDKTSESKFKKINEAYSVLSDDSKRQQYDMFGSTGGNQGFGGGAGGFNVDVDLGDIFSSFFGGGDGNGGSGRKSPEQKGEDLEYNMRIDLKTSIFGGKETITFNKEASCNDCTGEGGSGKKSCNKCRGTGSVTYTQQSIFGTIQQRGICDECSGSGESFENICNTCRGTKRNRIKKDIEIDIPAGIDSGMVIKLTGEGNDGKGTKASGDLYLKFSVILEEKGLEREGVDLYYSIEIDVIEAILGTIKDINIHILGKRKIEINAGTSDASIIKISGDGVKHIDSDRKGDLFIKINVKIPKKLSKKERELYEEVAKEKKMNINNKKGIFEGIFS